MKNKNEIDKNLRSYSKYYRQLLINEGIKDIDTCNVTGYIHI